MWCIYAESDTEMYAKITQTRIYTKWPEVRPITILAHLELMNTIELANFL